MQQDAGRGGASGTRNRSHLPGQPVVRALPRDPSEAHPYGVRPDNRLTEDRTNPNDIPLRLDQ